MERSEILHFQTVTSPGPRDPHYLLARLTLHSRQGISLCLPLRLPLSLPFKPVEVIAHFKYKQHLNVTFMGYTVYFA